MAAKKTQVEVEWYGKEVGAAAAKTMKTNAKRVGMFLTGEVVKSLSIGQPAKRVGNRLVGLNPSRPGEPPHLLHGALRGSIDYRIDRSRRHIDIYIGAHTPYARALELGNPKATSRAHGSATKNVTSLASAMRTAGAGMPRPYLRPALKKNRDKAVGMLVRNIFKGTGVPRSKK